MIINKQGMLKVFKQSAITRAIAEGNAFKSRTTFTYMEVDLFLKIAKNLKEPYTDKLRAIDKYVTDGNRISDIPYLKIHRTESISGNPTFICVGHEGRHRAHYLKINGISKHMPVLITDSVVRWEEDGLQGATILIQQEEGSTYYRVNLGENK
tara:strand:+ start:8993 stop:9451 length:459 start_codon:yes stop_codon:yes gene_type:complete